MTDYNIDQLKQWSGQKQKSTFKFKVPSIRLEGTTGKFAKSNPPDDKGNFPESVEMPAENTIVILRSRRTFSAFQKGVKVGAIIKPSYRFYTNEFENGSSHITIWKTAKNERTEIIDSGSADAMKIKHPELKLENNLYVLTEDGEISKFKIKGASRGPFYEYSKKLKEEGKEIFGIKTKITSVKENGDAFDYYRTVFEDVGPADLSIVGPKLKEVAESLAKVDEDYNKTFVQPSDVAPIDPIHKDEIPTIQIEEPKEESLIAPIEKDPEEVNVGDIPF
jgi:hypothetical protein